MTRNLDPRRYVGDALRRALDGVERRLAASQAEMREQLGGQLAHAQASIAALGGRLDQVAADVDGLRFGHGTFLGDGLVLAAHPTGLQMLLDAKCRTVTPYVINGRYERELMTLWDRLVRPGDVVLEIGANQGYHTLALALRAGASGRVVAYEPNPRTARVLESNVVMNGLVDRIRVERYAVSDHDGRARFHALDEIPAGSKLEAEDGDWTDRLPGEFIEVDLRAASGALRDLPTAPRIVKLDAEGHEIPILAALMDALPAGELPVFVVELIPGTMGPHGGLERFVSLLEEHGLVAHAFQGRRAPEAVDAEYLARVEWEDVLLAPAGWTLA